LPELWGRSNEVMRFNVPNPPPPGNSSTSPLCLTAGIVSLTVS